MTSIATQISGSSSAAIKLRRAVCPYCGVGCQLVAKVQEGRIVDIHADKTAAPNYGLLCQKGAMLKDAGIWDEAGRLMRPMLRPRRDAELRPVSWDHAISFVVDRLVSIQRRHGFDAIAFYGSGQLDTEASYLFSKLFKAGLRTNNVDSNSRLCMSSAVAGYVQTFGADGPPTCYDDIFHADVFLVAGANMAANHPVLWSMVQRQRQRAGKCRIIVLDPRRTQTAAQADVHVPLRPGSDVAFMQLLARRLLQRGCVDRRYVESHTEQFAAYRDHLDALDERALLTACDVDSRGVDEVVDLLARGSNLLSFYCQGFNQSTSGVDKNSALINLHMQLGQVGKPGCGPFSLTGQPNAMGGRECGYLSHQLPGYRVIANPEHRAEMEKHWRLKPGTIRADPGLSAVPMFDAIGAGSVKAAWIACTNPVVSMPDANRIKQALAQAELVIHQDCYHPTETGLYADVLLPAAQWGEKTGTMTNSERRVQRSEKLFDAPGEAMPDWWIAARAGQALGLDGFDFVTAEQVWDEYRTTTGGTPCDQSGITNVRLAQGTVQWPCPNEAHAGTPRRYTDGACCTPTRRARFATPGYRPPHEHCDAEFPLTLTTGRVASQWHTRTRTGRVEALNARDSEPFIEMHPDDAQRFGVADVQWVKLIGRRGEATGRLCLTQDIRPGAVFMPFHWGDLHSPLTNTNHVTNPAFDAVSKQPELKACAVRVEPATEPPRIHVPQALGDLEGETAA